MTSDKDKSKFITESLIPENMLSLYAKGAFPMADNNGDLDWYYPELRTIIPLDNFNTPRTLRKFMEKSKFEFRFNFETMEIIKHCANRNETWISERLIEAYKGLIEINHLHSIGVYEDDCLIGGLYGVSFRGAFFGESMFSLKSQASKAALVTLIKHLYKKNFNLLDVQFLTDHLKMFGAVEISFQEYKSLLRKAYTISTNFVDEE